jgi:hypothetical protein
MIRDGERQFRDEQSARGSPGTDWRHDTPGKLSHTLERACKVRGSHRI